MGFTFNTAFIGPFAVSLAKGQAGSVQKFRYKIPVQRDLIAQGTFIMTGRIQASWSSGFSKDQIFDVGGNLNTDREFDKPRMILNEDLTLTALTDCSYVCASAVGIEQKVIMRRHDLKPGQDIVIPRYELLLVGGSGTEISVNGSDLKQGPRFIYGRTRELAVQAHSRVTLAALSFAG